MTAGSRHLHCITADARQKSEGRCQNSDSGRNPDSRQNTDSSQNLDSRQTADSSQVRTRTTFDPLSRSEEAPKPRCHSRPPRLLLGKRTAPHRLASWRAKRSASPKTHIRPALAWPYSPKQDLRAIDPLATPTKPSNQRHFRLRNRFRLLSRRANSHSGIGFVSSKSLKTADSERSPGRRRLHVMDGPTRLRQGLGLTPGLLNILEI